MGTVEIDFGTDGFKLTAVLSKDGNQWCVLYGRDLEDGVAGFGSTIPEAIADFKYAVRNT